MRDKRNVIIAPRRSVTENTLRLRAGNCLRNILVAPRRPQVVHRVSILAREDLNAGGTFQYTKNKNQECVEFPEPAAAASAAAVRAAAASLFTKSFSSLLGLKNGIRFA